MIDFDSVSPTNQPELWQDTLNLKQLHHHSQKLIATFKFDLHTPPKIFSKNHSGIHDSEVDSSILNGNFDNETEQTKWLIALFNDLFHEQNVTLVHATDEGIIEPEYLPNNHNGKNEPAKICFAHGFFASALHEISHWSIAGDKRRLLTDFGYWYAPDGRNEQQQYDFEKVEIKPQAIECLLTLACGRNFRVSQDNLFAEFDTSNSTFESDVFNLAYDFLHHPQRLPKDAQTLLMVLYTLCGKI